MNCNYDVSKFDRYLLLRALPSFSDILQSSLGVLLNLGTLSMCTLNTQYMLFYVPAVICHIYVFPGHGHVTGMELCMCYSMVMASTYSIRLAPLGIEGRLPLKDVFH